jgi:hypothetical protein
MTSLRKNPRQNVAHSSILKSPSYGDSKQMLQVRCHENLHAAAEQTKIYTGPGLFELLWQYTFYLLQKVVGLSFESPVNTKEKCRFLSLLVSHIWILPLLLCSLI